MSEPLDEAQLDDDPAPSGATSLERATMERAEQLLAAGELEAAATLLDETLREEGGGLAIRALRAKIDYAGGNFSSAAARYAGVAIEAEEIPSLRLNEALCFLRADRFDEAFAVLFGLLTRGIQSPRLWGYLGAALEHRGQYQEAGAAYLAGGYSVAARRMRRRKLDSTLVRAGAPGLEQDELSVPAEHAPSSSPDGAPGATRGVEALRDGNQQTSPPVRFESHAHTHTHTDRTELPRSFANLLSEPELHAAPTGEARPPGTLLDLTLATLLVVPADEPWSKHPSGLVIASAAPATPVYYDTRAFVARSAAAEPHSMRGSSASKGFTKLDLGRILLGPRADGETLHLLDLAGESVIVHDRYVVGFGAAHAHGGGVPARHEAPWPLEMLRFSGEGMLVLGLPDAILTYDVRSDDDFELRAASLIGWAGELEVFLDGDAAAGASRRVRFAGNGTVLLLTRPFATTSPIIPRLAGQRSPADR